MVGAAFATRRPATAGVLLCALILGACGGERGRAAPSADTAPPAAQADTTGSPGQTAQVAGPDPLEYYARLAGIDSAPASPLLELAIGGGYTDSAVLAALEPWLRAARSLDAPRRAAALIAADLVVARWSCPIPEPDRRETDSEGYRQWREQVSGRPVTREELEEARRAEEPSGEPVAAGQDALTSLEALGARFNVQTESGEGVEAHCLYRRNWAAEALALDSLHAVGDSALAELLLSDVALGGPTACSLNRQWVISEAERLLQGMTDSTLVAQLHSLLVDARREAPPDLQWC